MYLKTRCFYQFGPFRLDAEQRLLWKGDKPVPLTPKALETLVALVENQGRLVEKDELMKRLWPDTFVEENNLAFNVSVLRKALTDGQSGFAYIETIPKRGYRFVANVVQIEREPTGRAEFRSPGTLRPLAECPDEKPQSSKGANSALRVAAIADAPTQGASTQAVSARSQRARVLAVFLGTALVALAAFVVWPKPRPPLPVQRQITHDGQRKWWPMVTDGTRLYFTETVDGGLRPSEVLVSGGETAAVPTSLSNFALSDISPDSSELIGVAPYQGDLGSQLWAVPVLGGSPRRLGDLRGHDPTYSPSGRQIAYLNGSRLFVASTNGTDARPIHDFPNGSAHWPRWSPRGDRLRFTIQGVPDDLPFPSSLWEVSADGTNLRQLLRGWNTPPREGEANWTGDGKWFVYESERDGHGDIWALRERLIPALGMIDRPVQLTSGPMDFFSPIPSRKGKQIFAIGEQKAAELSRYDAANRAFEPYLSGISATWVSFTRDRNWIGYVQYPQRTLWRMRADGTDAKQLTFAPMQVSSYSWSPDGTRLAICEPWKIGLIARDGGQIDYPIPHDHDQGVPTWSQDGSRLVFGDVPTLFGQDDGTHTIHIFDLTTKQTSDLAGSKGLWSSRWSPDGRYIAALKIKSQDLTLFDWSSKRWRDLGAGPVNNLTWSSDSRYVYYDTPPVAADAAIYRVRVAAGHLERAASLGGLRRTAAWWSGLDRENSPLILRDIGSEEIYSLDLNLP